MPLGQTFGDFELILLSNASTDATDDICRRYEREDERVRFIRQPVNVGAAPNHTDVFHQARAPLFKWASGDDLYARDLLERCLQVLEDRPDVVLAHSLTAAIDEDNNLIQALEYPLTTDDPRPARRLESLLFGDATPGAVAADDFYGIIRSDVLRRVRPHDSFYHADQTFMRSWRCWGPSRSSPTGSTSADTTPAGRSRPIPRCARGVPTSTPSAPIGCDTPRFASLRSTAGRGGAHPPQPDHLGRPTSVLRRDRSLDGHPRHPPRPRGSTATSSPVPRRCSRTPSSTGGRRRPAGRPVTAGHGLAPRGEWASSASSGRGTTAMTASRRCSPPAGSITPRFRSTAWLQAPQWWRSATASPLST